MQSAALKLSKKDIERELKEEARYLVKDGYTIKQVAEWLEIPAHKIALWKSKESWSVRQESQIKRRLEDAIDESRIDPSPEKIKTVENLTNIHLKYIKGKKNETNQIPIAVSKGRRKKNNDFTGVDINSIDPFLQDFPDLALKQYQIDFLTDPARRRFCLKSRQIGFTFAIAWEILYDGLKTGKNKICISASKKQCGVIRKYIQKFAKKVFGITLKGVDEMEITMPNGIDTFEIVYLSTNSVTSQSFNGDIYFDEFCWIPKLGDILDTALAMATHKKYRQTFFSTPSIKTHESYLWWAGVDEMGNPKDYRISRHKITAKDAIEKGCDFFELEDIKADYTERQYSFLFDCEWIDNEASYFKWNTLEKCYYRETQEDGKIFYAKPPGYSRENPVYVGLDPNGGSTGGDAVGLVAYEVVTVDKKQKLRPIYTKILRNQSIKSVAEYTIRVINRFNASYFSYDVSGCGVGFQEVFNLKKDKIEHNVKIEPICYDINSKRDLVLHMELLLENQSIEIDQGDKLFIDSFLSIQTSKTRTGKVTFVAKQEKKKKYAGNNHAELFWAACHAATRFKVQGSRVKKGRRIRASAC